MTSMWAKARTRERNQTKDWAPKGRGKGNITKKKKGENSEHHQEKQGQSLTKKDKGEDY